MKLAILRENHLQALKALRRFFVICQEGGKKRWMHSRVMALEPA